MPDACRPLLRSLQGLNQTKSVNILCIFTKTSKKQLFPTLESELTENIYVENLCSLCIPVWCHNWSHAIYGSGYGTTIVNNNKLLQRDLETKLVIAQCYMCHVIIVTIVSLVSNKLVWAPQGGKKERKCVNM